MCFFRHVGFFLALFSLFSAIAKIGKQAAKGKDYKLQNPKLKVTLNMRLPNLIK